MDFTTKKIINNGIYMLSTIYGFLNAITCFIIQFLNVIVATNILQNNFQKTFSSKSKSTTSTTTTRSSIFSSKSEPATSAAAASPPLSATKTTNRKPSIFSSKSESATSAAAPPQPLSTAKTTTTRKLSTFSSKSESSTSSAATTTRRRSPFSCLFDSTPYSSPWMYSTSGDLIGSESGVFMASTSSLEGLDEPQWDKNITKSNNNIVNKRPKQPKINKKEYPPPIPSWRGKLPGDVPWSLSRHHVDGRLILKEQNIEHYEYLEATRDNGHLMLNLVVLKSHHPDQNDIIHDDESTTNRGEKKKRIQQEKEKDFKMINGDDHLGLKKRRTILAI